MTPFWVKNELKKIYNSQSTKDIFQLDDYHSEMIAL